MMHLAFGMVVGFVAGVLVVVWGIVLIDRRAEEDLDRVSNTTSKARYSHNDDYPDEPFSRS